MSSLRRVFIEIDSENEDDDGDITERAGAIDEAFLAYLSMLPAHQITEITLLGDFSDPMGLNRLLMSLPAIRDRFSHVKVLEIHSNRFPFHQDYYEFNSVTTNRIYSHSDLNFSGARYNYNGRYRARDNFKTGPPRSLSLTLTDNGDEEEKYCVSALAIDSLLDAFPCLSVLSLPQVGLSAHAMAKLASRGLC
jgi:hypothetical protein